jgi:ethanolamine ammonia-lyase small subunit
MLNYQSTSFHDQLFVREVMGLRRAPEFEAWLTRMGLADDQGRMLPAAVHAQLLNGIVGGGAMNDLVPEDPWAALRQLTPARIALGRAGAGLPTRELLQFGLDHAMARDAVHTPFDSATLAGGLQAMGLRTITVHSQAAQREVYLQRPDLGRRLDAPGTAQLAAIAASDPRPDVALVIGDGLSALAVQRHALALVRALLPGLSAWRCAPVVLAHQCRVALGDDVGERLGARLVLVLLGERPGLSSPDSLGAYLTWAPRVGRTDAERNCVSNIRDAGLAPALAARKLAWLVAKALSGQCTGVGLKDDSDSPPTPLGTEPC